MGISVEAQAALHVAIGSIPGCGLKEMTIDGGPSGTTVYCVVAGWSPSLHDIDMTWVATLPPGGDDASDLVAAFGGQLERQRRRSVAGIAALTARPFEWRMVDLPEFTHLQTDATPLLMDLEDARNGQEGSVTRNVIASRYSRPLVGIHRDSDDYGGHMLGKADLRVNDGTGRCSIARGIRIGRKDAQALPYRVFGPWIAVPQPLPETVLPLCEGRLVSEVAVTGPLHASRRVRSAQVSGAYTLIRMEPCDVGLGDIAGMDMDAAISHLREMVTTRG